MRKFPVGLPSFIGRCATLALLAIGSGRADTYGRYTYAAMGDHAVVTKFDDSDYDGSPLAIPSELGGLPVTVIDDQAFYACYNLTSVTVPGSVVTIGDMAFYDCMEMSDITLHDGVTLIGESAFNNCVKLSAITIPDSVVAIGDSAFANCTSLPSVVVPANVVAIGDWAFAWCAQLQSATLPDDLATLGDGSFYGCSSLRQITIPSAITSLNESLFGECATLTNVTLHAGITEFGDGIFSECYALPRVELPVNLNTIGSSAFFKCQGLQDIFIPAAVSEIGFWAFANCTSLTNITVAGANSDYASVDGVLYDKNLTTLIQCPGGKTGVCAIPAGVGEIGDEAFQGCIALTSVEIPATIDYIDEWLFYECVSLTNISVNLSNPAYRSIDGVLFDKAGTTLLRCPAGRSGVYQVPPGTTIIGDYAFAGCAQLTRIDVSAGVTTISAGAFTECAALQGVYFVGNAPDADGDIFDEETEVVVFYIPGKTGWSGTFAGRPTYHWGLEITAAAVVGDHFRCTVEGAPAMVIAIEERSSLTAGAWARVVSRTNLNEAGVLRFQTPVAPAPQARFYRAVLP